MQAATAAIASPVTSAAEIPARIQRCPVHHGWPIPFTAVNEPGQVDIIGTSISRWLDAVQDRLCGLCGEGVEGDIWFIGGAICVNFRLFPDVGMHQECAAWAFDLCPWLAARRDYTENLKMHAECIARYMASMKGAPVQLQIPRLALCRAVTPPGRRGYRLVGEAKNMYIEVTRLEVERWK
jgi:hypothetical protein